MNRALLILLLPLAVVLCGCPLVSWVVAQFAPPQKVKPKYTPPAGKKILVFVDDPFDQLDYEPIKGLLAERLNKQLVEHEVAGQTVPFRRMLHLVAATPGFNRLAISEVGQKLGADIVLYVRIDRFSLKDSEASPLWHGRFGTTVRMVDVATKARLWPTDWAEGLTIKPIELPTTEDASPQYGYEVAKKLADAMADRIAKLFYGHTIPVEEATRNPGSFATDSPEE